MLRITIQSLVYNAVTTSINRYKKILSKRTYSTANIIGDNVTTINKGTYVIVKSVEDVFSINSATDNNGNTIDFVNFACNVIDGSLSIVPNAENSPNNIISITTCI